MVFVVVDEVDLRYRNRRVVSHVFDSGQLTLGLAKHLIVAGETCNATPAVLKMQNPNLVESTAAKCCDVNTVPMRQACAGNVLQSFVVEVQRWCLMFSPWILGGMGFTKCVLNEVTAIAAT